MGYISIARWRDLEDGHLYKAGDPFPHDGRDISFNRLEELTGVRNKAGFAVIQAFKSRAEENTVHEAEEPKKTIRSRKKA